MPQDFHMKNKGGVKMKKIITFLLSLLLIVSFVSCNGNETQIEETPLPSISQEDFGELITLYLEGYSEYEAHFFENPEIPDCFVPYDKLQFMGEFKALSMLEEITKTEYKQYMYTFVDENDFEFVFYVYYGGSDYEVEIEEIPLPDDMTNMRYISEINGTKKIIVNGLEYYYVNGKISSIEWTLNNIEFIVFDTYLDTYPVNGAETFVKRLLSLDTAESALQEFTSNFQNA